MRLGRILREPLVLPTHKKELTNLSITTAKKKQNAGKGTMKVVFFFPQMKKSSLGGGEMEERKLAKESRDRMHKALEKYQNSRDALKAKSKEEKQVTDARRKANRDKWDDETTHIKKVPLQKTRSLRWITWRPTCWRMVVGSCVQLLRRIPSSKSGIVLFPTSLDRLVFSVPLSAVAICPTFPHYQLSTFFFYQQFSVQQFSVIKILTDFRSDFFHDAIGLYYNNCWEFSFLCLSIFPWFLPTLIWANQAWFEFVFSFFSTLTLLRASMIFFCLLLISVCSKPILSFQSKKKRIYFMILCPFLNRVNGLCWKDNIIYWESRKFVDTWMLRNTEKCFVSCLQKY